MLQAAHWPQPVFRRVIGLNAAVTYCSVMWHGGDLQRLTAVLRADFWCPPVANVKALPSDVLLNDGQTGPSVEMNGR